jgi:hypothetical protein
MSSSQKTLNERTAASTQIDDLAPQQELSADALNSVVGGLRAGATDGGPAIKVKGGHGDTCEHDKFKCD